MSEHDEHLQAAAAAREDDLERLADMGYDQRRYLGNLAALPAEPEDDLECDHEEHAETSSEGVWGLDPDFHLLKHDLLALGAQLTTAIRDPYSSWHPFGGKSTTALQHDIVCVHTMVGTLAGSWSWANQAGNPYWHYGLNAQGDMWQCQDLAYKSAANLNGNWRVIPIETSDIGEGVFASTWQNPLWTQAQMDRLVDVISWLCVRFGIPPVLIPDTCPGRRGLAYHRQGIVPQLRDGCERWSNANGKQCPADRATQFVNLVIPRVRARVLGTAEPGEGLLAALTDEQQHQIWEEICGNPDTSRLGEVTVKVRSLAKGGFFATRENTPDVVYWVFADKSGRIKMLAANDPMRDWFGYTSGGGSPIPMARDVIDGIPVVGESNASKAASA